MKLIINHTNEHHRNRFGVCTDCAMKKAEFIAGCESVKFTDDPKQQREIKRKLMWDEFWKLTTPNGRSC